MFPTQPSLTTTRVGLLITAGQRWQFSSPCGSIDNSGVGGGRVDNSLLPTTGKAWLHSTRLPLTPSLGEEGGGSFLPGEGASPGSGVVSLDVVGNGDSSVSSRMKVSALDDSSLTPPPEGAFRCLSQLLKSRSPGCPPSLYWWG